MAVTDTQQWTTQRIGDKLVELGNGQHSLKTDIAVAGDKHRGEMSALEKRMGERFNAVDQRFDAVDQRFNAVDQRFDAVDQRFNAVDQRFDALEKVVVEIRDILNGSR